MNKSKEILEYKPKYESPIPTAFCWAESFKTMKCRPPYKDVIDMEEYISYLEYLPKSYCIISALELIGIRIKCDKQCDKYHGLSKTCECCCEYEENIIKLCNKCSNNVQNSYQKDV